MTEINCPFCGEDGFDLVGLKSHLTGEGLIFAEGCQVFRDISATKEKLLDVFEFMKLNINERRKLLAEQANDPEILAYYQDVVADMHAIEDKGMME